MNEPFRGKTKGNSMNSMTREENYHSLIIDHLNAIIKLDVNGNVLTYNEVFQKQYGYTEQGFHESFLENFIKDYTDEQKQYFKEAYLGKTKRFHALVLCKNGDTNFSNVSLVPIATADGMEVYVIIKNSNDLKEHDRELLLFKENFKTIEKIGNIGSFHYDMRSDQTYCSKQNRLILGISEEENFSPTHQQIREFVHPDDHPKLELAIQQTLLNNGSAHFECRIVRRDRAIRQVYVQIEVFFDEQGQPVRVIGFVQDITNSKHIESKLMEKEKQFSQIYNNLDVGVWSIDMQTGQFILCSQGIEQICGYAVDEMENKKAWSSIIHPEDLQQYVDLHDELAKGNTIRHPYRIIHKNGDIKWVQDYMIPTIGASGTFIQLDGLITDITEQHLLHEKVKHISYHDHLTKLPNRRKFNKKLQKLANEYANSDRKFAVMIIDVDHFKYINDTIGYPSGDELLCQISVRLASLLPSKNMLARLGGDEFGVLVANLESIESLEMISNQMIDGLIEPFLINGYELYVTISIGISMFPDNGTDSSDLLSNADIALNKAEKQGESKYHIISRASSIDSYKSYSLGRDIRKALENNEMTLHFQPRVDTCTGEIMSAEALIRWEHPEWGLVSPMEFLPIAEENGLIVHIDDWVLSEVCKQLKEWKEEQLFTVPISINISAVHFMKQDWLHTIEKTIQEAGIYPQDLEFEMTESSCLNNKEIAKNTMNALKDMGITISLDDFGTGYSSLSYLTQFPFDVIKIDKSFIQNMIHSDQDMFIAKSIIYLAKGLQIKVVAEGVETIQQLDILKKEECHQIQGYLFSRPVPNQAFKTLLQKRILQPN
ncbi:EAL domain-containing protein [Peribacillus loiseleuriae]|uniref:EAL domain-containing protein n=1 Tax=Peribacillus loiseleuriae TaxID=1679170 RepID=UPI000A6CE615|nr:EAL domain-containing protein [Peribacillus loiseleuriae]